MLNISPKFFFIVSVFIAVIGLTSLVVGNPNKSKTDSASASTLEERIAVLEALLAGVQRGTSLPNAQGVTVPYLYFPMRVGIQTDYWAKQPSGEGAALSVSTANDRRAAYIWNESAGLNGTIYGVLSDVTIYRPGQTGQNVGLAALVTNGPQGNEGLHVMSQYGGGHPTYPITPVVADEINVDGILQKSVILSPNGLVIRGGGQPANSFWGSVFGGASKQLFP